MSSVKEMSAFQMKLFLIMSLLLPLTGCFLESYDNCILKHVSNAASDKAAEETKLACINKYEDELPISSLYKIVGKAGVGNVFGSKHVVSGEIINGNENWIVTELKIVIYPNGEHSDSYTHIVDVYVGPTEKGFFEFMTHEMLEKSEEFTWDIVSAKGIKINL